MKLYIVIILILVGCNQKPHESDQAVVNIDSIKEEVVNQEEKVAEVDETKDLGKFISYERDGVLLPTTFIRFNDNKDSLGSLSIEQFEKVVILEKTYEKLPFKDEDDYCSYANLLRVLFKKDTFILSGENVLEITNFYNKLQMQTDTINLILAEDFMMKSADDDGLTGCADFNYLLIEDNGVLSYIMPLDNDDEMIETTLLHHNEGIEQKIKNVKLEGDTLTLEISEFYQDGEGSKDINIYRSGRRWRSSESNQVGPYY